MRQLTIQKSITIRDGGSFDRYLSEVAKEELLTPDEEASLARKAQNRDEEAIELFKPFHNLIFIKVIRLILFQVLKYPYDI